MAPTPDSPLIAVCALCGTPYLVEGERHVCADLAEAQAWNRQHRAVVQVRREVSDAE